MAKELTKLNEIIEQGEPSEESLEEELTEQALAAQEILERQKTERLKQILTNPSAIALTTTKHGAGEGVSKVKKTTKQLFTLYLTNQFVARAINIRADTIISKGYEIVGEDEKGVKACKELIEKSGGKNLFWQVAVNSYIAGDGFLEKVYNLKGNKILGLKHVHPLTLSFKKDEKTGRIIIDSKTKQPVGYVQHYLDKNGKEVEKDVDKKLIAHMKFNTLGDEFTGLSIIQPGYSTIVRLMNMEYSAAEAAIKAANPLIVGICNTKSPSQIALWGHILGRINGRDQIFVPQDMKIEFMSPGNQNFNEYAAYFLDAVVATFGVPKSVLLGESDNSNRAEGVVLTRHFYTSIASDQQSLSDFFYNIFKEYGELQGFEAPRLVFGDVAEDASLMARSALELFGSGIITLNEAREMIGLRTLSEDKLKKLQGIEADLKKSDMAAWHPASPGKAAGSQAGEKTKAKTNPFSQINRLEK